VAKKKKKSGISAIIGKKVLDEKKRYQGTQMEKGIGGLPETPKH